jgi:DNA topoisomerase-2
MNFDDNVPLAQREEEHALAPKKSVSTSKKTVEEIYQKKSQVEHILLRPDTYIGSVEAITQPMWVWDSSADAMVYRDISFVPGLYKIFDEILVNAADNKVPANVLVLGGSAETKPAPYRFGTRRWIRFA